MTQGMTQYETRKMIRSDEWLGLLFLAYFHKFDPSLFWPFFVAWFIFVYGLSYVPYWRQYNAWPWRKTP